MARRRRKNQWEGWVKVQKSLIHTGPTQMLVYSQDRSIFHQGDLDHDLSVAMGDYNRVYMRAQMTHDGLLLLDAETATLICPW